MTIWLRKWLVGSPPIIDERDDTILDKEDVTSIIEQNEAFVKQMFQKCSDLVCHKIHAVDGKAKRLIVYLETITDEKKVSDLVLKPYERIAEETETLDSESIPVGKSVTSSNWAEIVKLLLRGYAIVFTAGETSAVCLTVNSLVHRSIEEPSSEPVIRGPKEGFIERQSVNVGLLRNYIRTPRLKMEAFTLGEITETNVLVTYIEGLADESVVDQVRDKIASIRVDGVLESGYIEELIQDNPIPLFPTVQVTERPDVVAGGLLEGRVAILVDNTPFVLVVPVTFWNGMQASEDYYLSYPVATFVRWIRFIFLFIAIFAPSLFVAVTTCHQEMIPTSLLLSIASARELVPLPVMIETLLMEIMFEALREAGLRLPRTIGQTVKHRRRACHRAGGRTGGHYFGSHSYRRIYDRYSRLCHTAI
ncbi:spore germination protein [Paenibacillus sp. V4I5]|uniref:spore germination protein n=1 Tax=Paenibacillus sp. V4I5 TaxID=3042306 RepID=UPI00279184BB|nr:spore germination protein [Paenibacillus sp. V4I5]MDQ0919549.1 spore germination protein [Paenibacillus sp. V4I5]